jgi:hypothetical protein
LQSWPLLYLGAGTVGFIIRGLGWIMGRQTWIRFGMWFTIPLFLLLGSLATVFSISGVVHMFFFIFKLTKR